MHTTLTAISPPELSSPRLGDEIRIVRDALLELQVGRRMLRTWDFVERGTRARLVARQDNIGQVVLIDGPLAGEVVFVSERMMTRAPARGTLGVR